MDVRFNITADGVEYGAMLTMGAMHDFKKRTGRELSEATDDDVFDIIYYCVKSMAERNGEVLPFNVDNFSHFLSVDEGVDAINAYVDAINNASKKKTETPKAKN